MALLMKFQHDRGDMASSTTGELDLFARYHGWATKRLLMSVADLPDDIYRRPCGLFFGSIHGTLNHLLLTDAEIWFPRFAENRSPSFALDTEIASDRPHLADRLQAGADRWSAFVARLAPEQFAGDLLYRTTQGTERRLPYAAALLHVFNHATHHRGQITAAISGAGLECLPLDLLVMIGQDMASRQS
jgi:uncharacterized damage-inducible protein DinB